MTEPVWVVTYRVALQDETILTEFYRGPRSECQRISAASATGEDDCRRTHGRWQPFAGPAKRWDAFVSDALKNDGVVEGR